MRRRDCRTPGTLPGCGDRQEHSGRPEPRGDGPAPTGTLSVPLWRAIAVFRFAALGYVLVLYVRNAADYAHPFLAAPVLLGMIVWTIIAPGMP